MKMVDRFDGPGAAAVLLLAFACLPAQLRAAPIPAPAHTVIVILENHSASQVYGNPEMPFFNEIARQGAMLTQASFAQIPYGRIARGYVAPLPARPSQPNYLFLMSGSNQRVLPEYFAINDAPATYPYRGTVTNAQDGDLLAAPRANVPAGIGNRLVPAAQRPFTTPNLGAAVIAHGGTFACFSETLPYPRFDGETYDAGAGLYKRKHNPVINWINLPGRALAPPEAPYVLPDSVNLAFSATVDPASGQRYRGFMVDEQGRPLGFDALPAVSIVVPNQAHDAHDASLGDADTWLAQNMRGYAQWAMAHNSLLILTFDEDGATKTGGGDAKRTGIDTIATVFYGPMVKPGRYSEPADHLNVLSTVLRLHADLAQFQEQFARAHPGEEAAQERANLRPILDIFGAGAPLTSLPPEPAR